MESKVELIGTVEILGKEIKFYGSWENPLFLGKDVAEWIEYSKDGKGNYNVSVMLSKIDDDEKIKLNTNLNNVKVGSNTWFLTEDGLYEVLMKSRKPIAKAFKKEVKKILKELRTKGTYTIQQKPKTQEELAKDSMFALVYNKINNTEKRLEAVQHIADYSRTLGKGEICDNGTITIPGVKNYVMKHYGDILMENNVFLSDQFIEFHRFLAYKQYLEGKRFKRKSGVGMEKKATYQPTNLFYTNFVEQGFAQVREIDNRGKLEITYTKDIEKYIASSTFKREFCQYLGIQLNELEVA